MDDWLKLALLGGAAASGAGLLAAPAAAGAAGTGASLASMGGGAGLVPGAAGAAGLSAPASGVGLQAPLGALATNLASEVGPAPPTGGLLSQASPYLRGANNVLGAASAAKNLTTDPQVQAPSAGLGGGQPVRLGQNLTANQRRLRGLLG